MRPRTAIIILISATLVAFGIIYFLYKYNLSKELKPAIIQQQTEQTKDDRGSDLTVEEKRMNVEEGQKWLDENATDLTIEEKRKNAAEALELMNK